MTAGAGPQNPGLAYFGFLNCGIVRFWMNSANLACGQNQPLTSEFRLGYCPALDGLRAVSILMVLSCASGCGDSKAVGGIDDQISFPYWQPGGPLSRRLGIFHGAT